MLPVMPYALTTAAEATPAWLTAVLRRSGALPFGTVAAVEVTRTHHEQLHSASAFLALTYTDAPPDAPQALFLKLPRQPDAPGPLSTGAREVKLYQAAASMPRRMPLIPCYDAVYDQATRRYHLLLADLSATHDQPAWHLSVGDAYITRTVDCLAQLHAAWWQHPALAAIAGTPPAETERSEAAKHLRAAFSAFAEASGAALSPAGRTSYERMLAALPTPWQTKQLQRQTLVHGDAHFWNLLYPRDPASENTVIIDWQTYHSGRGVDDLAYTLVLRDPQRTPANEHALVARYHAALVRNGIADYSWATCWLDYRQAAADMLLYPLGWYAGGLPYDFWHMFVARALAAFDDLGCATLLPA